MSKWQALAVWLGVGALAGVGVVLTYFFSKWFVKSRFAGRLWPSESKLTQPIGFMLFIALAVWVAIEVSK
jgi:hypothetical protein